MNNREITQMVTAINKIDAIGKDIKEIKEHLKELNGQVNKNSLFRVKTSVIISILIFVSGALVVALINFLIRGFP